MLLITLYKVFFLNSDSLNNQDTIRLIVFLTNEELRKSNRIIDFSLVRTYNTNIA